MPDLIHQREQIISKVFRKLNMQQKLKERWKEINYTPPVPEQLKLFANDPTRHVETQPKR